MTGKKSEEEYYAYLDGKHQAMYLIETQNLAYNEQIYKVGCKKWGYHNYVDEFLRGVHEAYSKVQEMRRSGYIRSFPKTIRPCGVCHSADKVDVSEMWRKMHQ